MEHGKTRIIQKKERSSQTAALIKEIARKIALHTPSQGLHVTDVQTLPLYRKDEPSPCYPATYPPSVASRARAKARNPRWSNVPVQGVDISIEFGRCAGRKPSRCGEQH